MPFIGNVVKGLKKTASANTTLQMFSGAVKKMIGKNVGLYSWRGFVGSVTMKKWGRVVTGIRQFTGGSISIKLSLKRPTSNTTLQLFSGSVSGQKSGTKTGSGGGTTWKAWVGTVIQKLSLGRSTSNTLLQLFSGLVSGKKSLLRSTSNTTLQLFSGAVTGVKSILKTWSGGNSTWQAWTSTLLQKLSLKRPLTNTTAQLFSGTVTYWRPGMAHNYYASVGGGSFSVSGSVSKKYGLFRSLSGHFGKLKGRGATYKDELYYGVPAP